MDEREFGELISDVKHIRQSMDTVVLNQSEYIKESEKLRRKCHERMTKNEAAIAYTAERRRSFLPFITAVIAFLTAIGALWVAFGNK